MTQQPDTHASDIEERKRRDEAQRRLVLVTALRDLATYLETNTELPVPFHGHLQASVTFGQPQAGRFAALRAAADLMGVDVVERESGAREVSRAFGPIEYFVHVNADEPRRRRRADRVVPAEEDAQLLAAVATQPQGADGGAS